MQKRTDWEHVSRWYHKQVGTQGHYYHQHTVLPAVIKHLDLHRDSKLLDVACGNGVLSHQIPKNVEYVGIDGAATLIQQANRNKVSDQHQYLHRDAMKPFRLPHAEFTHATIVLALQNIQDAAFTIQEISKHLIQNGKLVIVLNHPSFRIPRQSSWEIDPRNKTQYRRVDRYFSEMEIPLNAHPGQRSSEVIWTYHQPLQNYTKMLFQAGLVIEEIEEMISDKTSQGKNAKMENRSREEFPLFMLIRAQKIR